MREADNDNETWIRIGLAAARLLQRLDERSTKADDKPKPEKGDGHEQHQKKVSEHDAYIEWRVREADRFERFAKGERTRRKRMK